MSTCAEPSIAAHLSIDDLLAELRRRHWTLYRWGPLDEPAFLAGTFRWSTREVDVLLLRPDRSGSAYRAPLFVERELFRPCSVMWEYHCRDALWTLRAVLSLPAPNDPTAPLSMYAPNRQCSVPDGLPSPVVFRPLGR